MEVKRNHCNIIQTMLLAAGIMAGDGASAESLAGLGVQYKFISPASFMTKTPGCGQGGGGFYARGCTDVLGLVVYQAPIDLPEGSLVQHVYAWYYDNSSTGSISITVERTSMDFAAINSGSSGAITSILGTGTSSSDTPSPYWHMATMTPTSPFVINSWKTSGAIPVFLTYSVFVQLTGNDSGLGFNGALIAYQRQIAPAPAAADFSDVPTTHPFFNEVEQLKKSGVTQGCGNGQFCPDAPVTRGQMAAFLSRALGLQWNPPV